jgi:ribosome maturation factor RimP
MTWKTAVERTVAGMGYELVELERSSNGLLRVFIDRLPGKVYPTGESESVTVDDCEAVTRQLQYVLEVENVDYGRLEVSSPGLDRPLKKPEDFARFAGAEVDLTLKLPLAGRKKFRGTLLANDEAPEEGVWRLVFNDGKGDQALDFKLEEVRETRLVPVVDFKGRRGRKADAGTAATTADGQDDGGHKE